MTDRDTGKQKGFAFLEFFDTQTAESAIRNLNEHDLNGRKLKVHFAANDMDSKIRQGKGVLTTQSTLLSSFERSSADVTDRQASMRPCSFTGWDTQGCSLC